MAMLDSHSSMVEEQQQHGDIDGGRHQQYNKLVEYNNLSMMSSNSNNMNNDGFLHDEGGMIARVTATKMAIADPIPTTSSTSIGGDRSSPGGGGGPGMGVGMGMGIGMGMVGGYMMEFGDLDNGGLAAAPSVSTTTATTGMVMTDYGGGQDENDVEEQQQQSTSASGNNNNDNSCAVVEGDDQQQQQQQDPGGGEGCAGFPFSVLKLDGGDGSCGGCGSLIMDRFVLNASGLLWHSDCLRCTTCALLLEQFPSCYFRDDRAYCKLCYNREFGIKCGRCSRVIASTDWVRRARRLVYHLACFACDNCKRQLSTGEEFALQDNRILCKQHYMELIDGDSAHHKRKTKRVRTTFTEDQLQVLQANFQVDSNPDGQDLERIAQITGLSKRVTQVWFQNSRARQKKYAGTGPIGGAGTKMCINKDGTVTMSALMGGSGSESMSDTMDLEMEIEMTPPPPSVGGHHHQQQQSDPFGGLQQHPNNNNNNNSIMTATTDPSDPFSIVSSGGLLHQSTLM